MTGSYQLSPDELVLLSCIRDLGARANWYQLGRAVVGQLADPHALVGGLKRLIEVGLVQEQAKDDGTPARLKLTEEGEQVFATSRQDHG